jgi:hypothetical protein
MRGNYRLPALATGLALFIVGCGETTANDNAPRSQQTMLPTPAEAWGPLAVAQSGNAVPDYTVVGTLRIGEECVTFEEKEDVLVIWPSGRVDWNADSRTITLESTLTGESEPAVLQDGDKALFVGLEKEPPESEVQDIDQLDWVNPPDPACHSDHRIFIELFERRATSDSS